MDRQGQMIPKQPFGRTGHQSTRTVFGAWALSEATQAEADRTLELLLEYGVNHIDTAIIYGNAEKRIGPWLEVHRADFFKVLDAAKRFEVRPSAADMAAHAAEFDIKPVWA